MKYFFSLSLLVFAFSCVHAQGFDLGVRLGTNISYFHPELAIVNGHNVPLKSVVGLLGGFQMDYRFNSAWAVSGQILLVQKRTSYSFDEYIEEIGMTTITENSSYDYIEIPLEAKFRFSNDTKLQPYVFAGATIGLLITVPTTETFSDSREEPYSFDFKNDTKSLDIGVLGGLGIDYLLMTNAKIFAEGGYRLGLINRTSGNSGSNIIADDNTVNDLRFSVGILFPIP